MFYGYLHYLVFVLCSALFAPYTYQLFLRFVFLSTILNDTICYRETKQLFNYVD